MNKAAVNRLIIGLALIVLGPMLLIAQPSHQWEVTAHLGDPRFGLIAVSFVDSLHGWTAFGIDSIHCTSDGGRS